MELQKGVDRTSFCGIMTHKQLWKKYEQRRKSHVPRKKGSDKEIGGKKRELFLTLELSSGNSKRNTHRIKRTTADPLFAFLRGYFSAETHMKMKTLSASERNV